jgi:hypothetical protein
MRITGKVYASEVPSDLLRKINDLINRHTNGPDSI